MSRPSPTLLLLLCLGFAACKDAPPEETGDIPTDDSADEADADNDGVPASSDCDDEDPNVYPGAPELCNGQDDDCDEVADEDATDATTFYQDGDADGYGVDGATQAACEQPEGYAAVGGDCDDSDPLYHPGAEEADCTDPNDYNCDGSVGFVDGDGDGFAACRDCDDDDAGSNPRAVEVCDGRDNDCDALVDDADDTLDLSTATSSWADADQDGYGDPASLLVTCETIDGRVTNDMDCDDADPAIFPGGTEVCDGADNDCDAQVDDADPDLDLSTASTGWLDGDGDGFGDAGTPLTACVLPSGAVSDATDCDDGDGDTFPGAAPLDSATACMRDADDDGYGDDSATGAVSAGTDCDDGAPSVYPGAPEDGGDGSEAGDGLDNDCDGSFDETLTFGSGADGAVSVTTDTSLADLGAVCTAVTALNNRSATVADSTGFAPGDRALLINLQGGSGASAALGAWELLDVETVGNTVRFLDPIGGTYGESSNSDLSGQKVALYRVPQFTDLTVSAGASLSGPAWDGTCGGVVAFLATGTVTVDGTLSADALGYAGGSQNTSYNSTGRQGESYRGTGTTTISANLGGGGGGGLTVTSCSNCEGTGAGGANATDGQDGQQANPSLGYGGVAGVAYGVAGRMTLGSGGGAGALDQSSERGIGGAGGAGGGVLVVQASTFSVTGLVSALGEDGEVGCAEGTNWCGTAAGSQPSEAEPGGGGAGGGLYLVTDDLIAGSATLWSIGGAGQTSGSSWARVSGDGGDGWIWLSLGTVNGYAYGTTGADTELGLVASPAPTATGR